MPTITGGSSDVAAAKGAAFGKREKKEDQDSEIQKYMRYKSQAIAGIKECCICGKKEGIKIPKFNG